MSLAATSAASSTHFQRLLPDWLKALHLRAQRLERDGWDINMLQLLHDDTLALAQDCRRFEVSEVGARLEQLQSQLNVYVLEQALPHVPQSTQLLRELRALAGSITPGAAAVPPPEPVPAPRPPRDGFILLDAETEAELSAAFPQSAPVFANEPPRQAEVTPATLFSDSEFTSRDPSTMKGQRYSIYHFSDGNGPARDFDTLFEADGHSVSAFETLDALLDALIIEAPHLLVLDPSLLPHAATVRAAAQDRREEFAPMRLLTFCAAEQTQPQLAALRAKVDLLVVLPADAEYVLQRVREILREDSTPPRVMVVHDDSIQLLMTEDALGEAGMQALAIADPFAALNALDSFKPELILIDLHQASCSATELVELIRARQGFLLTPIMFLSSDADPEHRLQALAAGSDAFLQGPVNSRRMVCEIRLRLQRVRQLSREFARRSSHRPQRR